MSDQKVISIVQTINRFNLKSLIPKREKQVKIAMISDNLGGGGAERQLLLCAAELEKLNHKVKVITYHPENDYRDLVSKNKIDIECIYSRNRIVKFFQLSSIIKKEKFDIVHGFKGTASFYASVSGIFAGRPPVIGGYRVRYVGNWKINLFYKCIDLFVNGWIVNAENIKESMIHALGIHPDKMHVLYNGVVFEDFVSGFNARQAKFKAGFPEDAFVVTKIANLCKDDQKNHRMFIETAACVVKKHKTVVFAVVGDGPCEAGLRDYAKELGISNSVYFMGRRNDIPVILSATDIAVLTSNYEGLPNGLLEPMCVGIPVVTTDFPGVDELVTDESEGYIVPRNNAEQMADKICELIENPDKRKEFGTRAQQKIKENFSTEIMAKRLVSIYEKILGKRQ